MSSRRERARARARNRAVAMSAAYARASGEMKVEKVPDAPKRPPPAPAHDPEGLRLTTAQRRYVLRGETVEVRSDRLRVVSTVLPGEGLRVA